MLARIADALLVIAIVLGGGLSVYACEIGRSRETKQVTIVRKFDACFVIYKDDIEPFPCPAPERQWVQP